MIRNPNLEIGGIEPFPNNAYDFSRITITIIDADYVNVDVLISRYADATKNTKIDLEPVIFFLLRNLPHDWGQLNPILFQTELLSQHGDEIVDGTALNDFIVL